MVVVIYDSMLVACGDPNTPPPHILNIIIITDICINTIFIVINIITIISVIIVVIISGIIGTWSIISR